VEYPFEERILALSYMLTATLFENRAAQKLSLLATQIADAYKAENGIVLTAGNGGSHAIAEHLSAELLWRLDSDRYIERRAVCISSNQSTNTAMANDIGYDYAYAQSAHSLVRKDDSVFLIGFSTSGRSENILNFLSNVRKPERVTTVLFGGQTHTEIPDIQYNFIVHSGTHKADVTIIQEVHMVMAHMLADMVYRKLRGK
jgi:D-sedoheptulose 7-phosphate isomerase